MRKSFAVLFLAVGALVEYSLHTVPIKAQVPASDSFPFSIGGSVSLSVDLPQGEITCQVIRVETGFLGCARDDQARQSARWINLRYVKVITPRVLPRASTSMPLTIGRAQIAVRFLRNEFLTAILPERKVKRSQPFTSTRLPSLWVPMKVHSDTPRLPLMRCLGLAQRASGNASNTAAYAARTAGVPSLRCPST